MKRVENLLIMKVMNIFFFPSFFPKGVKSPIKPRQRDKESDPPGKYINKPILEEISTGFRVFR